MLRIATKLQPTDLDGLDWNWFERHGAGLVDVLVESFALAATEAGMGPAQANVVATEWAAARGASMLTLTGNVSIVESTRRRVAEMVAQTIERGESLGTLTRRLREDFVFSRQRATAIARTETTTALGQGEKAAAISQERNEKHWVTQGDELVGDPCASNEAAGWIKLVDPFPTGVDTIPQHPLCRCVVRYRTRDPEEQERITPYMETTKTPWPKALLEIRREVRCPGCRKLLAKNVAVGTPHRCRRCKTEFRA